MAQIDHLIQVAAEKVGRVGHLRNLPSLTENEYIPD
jgi:hypothetical protein